MGRPRAVDMSCKSGPFRGGMRTPAPAPSAARHDAAPGRLVAPMARVPGGDLNPAVSGVEAGTSTFRGCRRVFARRGLPLSRHGEHGSPHFHAENSGRQAGPGANQSEWVQACRRLVHLRRAGLRNAPICQSDRWVKPQVSWAGSGAAGGTIAHSAGWNPVCIGCVRAQGAGRQLPGCCNTH